MTHAEEGDQISTKLIEKTLAKEFTADLSELKPEERVKFEWQLKNRDE